MATVPYWKLMSGTEKKLMTVPEMRKMLGLKKVESYWLIHQGNFIVTEKDGKYVIDVNSFEKWYANQTHYSKVNGPEPGEELREKCYSCKDIAEMLGISEARVYELLARDKVEKIVVGLEYWIPKEAFDKWYQDHPRYRTAEDKERDRELEESSIWLPDVARMLGIERDTAYSIIETGTKKGIFEVIEVACRKRVTKESFYKWYDGQSQYKILPMKERKEREAFHAEELQRKKLKRLAASHKESAKNACIYDLKEPKNPNYYTIKEITELYGFAWNTVMGWIKKGYVPADRVGKEYLLPRDEFDDWLDMMST